MRKTGLIALVFVALAAVALPAQSQATDRTKGFNLGVALNGSSIKIDDDELDQGETNNGGGLSIYGGYNFTRNLGVFLGGSAAQMNTDDDESYTLAQGDLGVRYLFNSTSAFVPYVELAFTGLSASRDFDGMDVELSGEGFTGGLGFNYFVSQRAAIDINLKVTHGEFDTVKFEGGSISADDGVGTTTGRLSIGIAFYPSFGKPSSARR